ncbi:type I secretion system permease/ATPase [Sphingomonas sp. CGMCC 1.13654]|uniref:Type I secretion system permease/ATPase n=1 Tax=Sphingomonas chungangi TaxID=2683589 RepID=A0A838L9X4_9SPHN|nr:type I secretion system permease/ATPase [Sphingomonas chungangi]MBA2935974.1 type I secretion system permease/ATPase [Sphingomonas chungangi]MVW55364.1 type I secretion system permease/ATPase [Sphingomonas chungangi]
MAEGRTSDGGAEAFALACVLHGVPADPADMTACFAPSGSFDETAMLRAAGASGLRARLVRPAPDRLGRQPLPALARDADGRWLVVARIAGPDGAGRVLFQYPGRQPEVKAIDDFVAGWDGTLLLMRRKEPLASAERRFGLGWFLAAVMRYRRVLSEVLVASVALQLLGLATPLFFQVVVDKVLVHRGFSTLDVVVTGMAIALTFEVLLGGIRSYLFSHTANRIDVELGARTYRHLLSLPLGYFGARRVGDSVARVRELESIRQFMTGSTLTLAIDLTFGSLYLALIFWYAPLIGWVVTASIPLYVLISLIATPVLRDRINERFRRGAENQALLVESVTGIETIKAMAVEPGMQRRWETQLASYVAAAFSAMRVGIVATQAATFVSRLTTLLVLYLGAHAVIRGDLTIGELVAVNMLAGQIATPVLRLAQLWQDFQQARISVERVGDILNSPAEPRRTASAPPPLLSGAVTFEDVRFRYRIDAPPALDGLTLHVPAGRIIGVVGPSGSGKSTIARLVQRLHVPETGRVLIDGIDAAMLDPAWLRRQVGLVLQDSMLFRGSVHENIALSNPGMTIDRVVAAARLAGAYDFIAALPQGFETEVGERGATLSGGQRQRIAIARMLATDPRILIFDEATSALDLESEQAIQQNMQAICQGRTVIIIAHRLSALRMADRIVTVEGGRIIEDGNHASLLAAGGRYARLWRAQISGIERQTA